MKMNGKLKKIMVSALTCITLLSTTYGSVFADTSVGSVREDITNEVKIGQDTAQSKQSEYSETLSENGDIATNVYATLASYFDVVIPKTVILDGKTGEGAYTVDVNADIAANEVINIVPDSSFALSSVNKSSISATVSQNKTQWLFNEANENATGIIKAEDLSAGSWSGTFNFNIGLEKNSLSSVLSLSTDNVTMGTGNSVQVNAYLDGELANEEVIWVSDNENITVTDGLIETNAAAQVGDTATVTVSAVQTAKLSMSQRLLQDLGLVLYANAADDISIDFTVTIVDIEYSVDEVNIKPGESQDVTAKILPETVSGTVGWSSTAVSGINLVKNGNTVTIKVAEDMPVGNKYSIIATFGDYSRTLGVNIISSHVHSYTETITKEATCTESGVKTFTCECGDSYTEVIDALGHNFSTEYVVDVEATCITDGSKSQHCSRCDEKQNVTVITATGHNYNGGVCSNCGDVEALEAGLYDANGVMLCTWEESGINVEKNYINSPGKEGDLRTTTTSPFYVLKNLYPDAVKVVIPEGVTILGQHAFAYCSQLQSIVLPSSLNRINYGAFYFMDSLESVGLVGSESNVCIPSNVVNIGSRAFANCKNLKTVNIPYGVETIGEWAFENDTLLDSIYIPDSITKLGHGLFSKCTSLKRLYIPESVETIGTSASNYQYGLFYNSSYKDYTYRLKTAIIYCGASSKPAGWFTGWNAYGYGKKNSSTSAKGVLYNSTVWGKTREQYDAIVNK